VVADPSGKKPAGLFDWAAYRKQHPQGANAADGVKLTANGKKLKKAKPGSPDVQSASANTVALEKLIKIPPKAKTVKAKKPVVDCKADPSAKECKPADVTPASAEAPATPTDQPKT